MPSNNSNAHKLNAKYPGCIGQLMGPGGWRDPQGLPFALDNGRFVSWSKGAEWDESLFHTLMEKALPHKPMWVVVPDSVGDADETFRMWDIWSRYMPPIPLAMAVQDGMTPDSVRRHANPDVIFVGGTTNWKRNTIWRWCHEFPRVHVGRVNTKKWLWNCTQCGAESCDGTGWFRGNAKQLAGLHQFLRRYSSGMPPAQMKLEFARTFGDSVPNVTYVR